MNNTSRSEGVHNSKLRIKHSKLNTLFLPNEPNLKSSQNDISHFLKRAKSYKLMVDSWKNEAKRSQIPLIPQTSSLRPQDYKKIQNKPNFKTSPNDVSHFQKANCLKLKAKSCRKNKANQTQFSPHSQASMPSGGYCV